MPERNIAEELWEVYHKEKHQGLLTGEELRRHRTSFFHGLYCGQDMLLKAMKLPEQRMVDFIREFRDQIASGLSTQGDKLIIQNIKGN